MSETLKIKVRGIVKGNYVNVNDKTGNEDRQINIIINERFIDMFEAKLDEKGYEWSGDNYPIKVDNDTDLPYLKLHSQFSIKTKNLPSGFTIADLGAGSDITAYVNVKNGKYGRRQYVSAYISALECHKFIEMEEYDAFQDSEFESLDDNDMNVVEGQETSETALNDKE